MAGYTVSSIRKLVTIPPTIGAAILFITSEPIPVPSKIGSNPSMVVITVIILGRILFTAPSKMASLNPSSEPNNPFSYTSHKQYQGKEALLLLFQHQLQVKQ